VVGAFKNGNGFTDCDKTLPHFYLETSAAVIFYRRRQGGFVYFYLEEFFAKPYLRQRKSKYEATL